MNLECHTKSSYFGPLKCPALNTGKPNQWISWRFKKNRVPLTKKTDTVDYLPTNYYRVLATPKSYTSDLYLQNQRWVPVKHQKRNSLIFFWALNHYLLILSYPKKPTKHQHNSTGFPSFFVFFTTPDPNLTCVAASLKLSFRSRCKSYPVMTIDWFHREIRMFYSRFSSFFFSPDIFAIHGCVSNPYFLVKHPQVANQRVVVSGDLKLFLIIFSWTRGLVTAPLAIATKTLQHLLWKQNLFWSFQFQASFPSIYIHIPAPPKRCQYDPKGWLMGTPYHSFSTP